MTSDSSSVHVRQNLDYWITVVLLLKQSFGKNDVELVNRERSTAMDLLPAKL
jgi:hypothetical protein